MSVNETDPGYANLIHGAQVFCDGVKVPMAVTADEELGLIVEYDGTRNGDDWNTVERRGVVRIVVVRYVA